MRHDALRFYSLFDVRCSPTWFLNRPVEGFLATSVVRGRFSAETLRKYKNELGFSSIQALVQDGTYWYQI